MNCSVLVVTAYSNLRETRVQVLKQAGFRAEASKNLEDAERLIAEYAFEALLLGSDISRKSASRIVDRFRARNQQSPIILLGRPALVEDLVDRVLLDPDPTELLETLRDVCSAAAD